MITLLEMWNLGIISFNFSKLFSSCCGCCSGAGGGDDASTISYASHQRDYSNHTALSPQTLRDIESNSGSHRHHYNHGNSSHNSNSHANMSAGTGRPRGVSLGSARVSQNGAKRTSRHANMSPSFTADGSVTVNHDEEGSASQSSGISAGDATRRLFYKLIFLALLSRTVLLPIQAFYFAPQPSSQNQASYYPHVNPQTGMCVQAPGCVVARTLPDLAFASAYCLLVIFYAKLASSSGSSAPQPSENGQCGQSVIHKVGARLGRFMSRRGTYQNWNFLAYSLYGASLFFTGIIPLIPYNTFQLLTYLMMSIIYFFQLCLLAYYGPNLYIMLRVTLKTQAPLSRRLIGMGIVCGLVFICRTITFSVAVWNTNISRIGGQKFWHYWVSVGGEDLAWNGLFGRDALGDIAFELFPTLMILIMMHRTRKFTNTHHGTDSPPIDASGNMRTGSQQGSGTDLSATQNIGTNNNRHIPSTSYSGGIMRSKSSNAATTNTSNSTSMQSSGTVMTTKSISHSISKSLNNNINEKMPLIEKGKGTGDSYGIAEDV
eukprot:CAMPEP_0184866228 /NCGR_PEP_ID=MMETSP0580-20130426/21453_1 /TAXON_ID=1118495 /ORGANISM="Dactyliosolen fragilissimus" /LENGTH=544 /DNA_ID=CAMNT_0027365795 /DNA_START=213 /DNA_END=1847 /DNA_ORIENTATION=-